MVMKTIDCRNMGCPIPVVTTKRALEESPGQPLQVLVDPGAPRENVTRFAVNRGFVVEEAEVEGGIALTMVPSGTAAPAINNTRSGKTVMLISSDRLGDGPEELGRL